MPRQIQIRRKLLQFAVNIEQAAVRLFWRQLLGESLTIGAGVYIDRSARIKLICDGVFRGGRVSIGDGCVLGQGVVLAPYGGEIVLEPYVHVNEYTVLYGHGGLRIRSKVMIAAHCVIVPANHGIAPGTPIYDQPESRRGIVIEEGVWVGAGCRLLDGIIVGRGAVVAAGAVVTSNVAAESVVAGVPARVIRFRGEGSA